MILPPPQLTSKHLRLEYSSNDKALMHLPPPIQPLTRLLAARSRIATTNTLPLHNSISHTKFLHHHKLFHNNTQVPLLHSHTHCRHKRTRHQRSHTHPRRSLLRVLNLKHLKATRKILRHSQYYTMARANRLVKHGTHFSMGSYQQSPSSTSCLPSLCISTLTAEAH
jgi:hypothetical protein